MCGSKIEDGKCDCGIWIANPDCPIRKGLESFHDMKRMTLTADAPHLGCAVVYFRGDYNDCQKVQKFIYGMKGRPYYET